jgi:hypothetical protein
MSDMEKTVGNGEEKPSEDRDDTSPVASTIPSHDIVSVEETALGRSKTRVCYTSLLHQQPLERSENASGTTASADLDCYTNLLPQPSKRSPSPSSRSPRSRCRYPPGLIVRGRVFHVRVKVRD